MIEVYKHMNQWTFLISMVTKFWLQNKRGIACEYLYCTTYFPVEDLAIMVLEETPGLLFCLGNTCHHRTYHTHPTPNIRVYLHFSVVSNFSSNLLRMSAMFVNVSSLFTFVFISSSVIPNSSPACKHNIITHIYNHMDIVAVWPGQHQYRTVISRITNTPRRC